MDSPQVLRAGTTDNRGPRRPSTAARPRHRRQPGPGLGNSESTSRKRRRRKGLPRLPRLRSGHGALLRGIVGPWGRPERGRRVRRERRRVDKASRQLRQKDARGARRRPRAKVARVPRRSSSTTPASSWMRRPTSTASPRRRASLAVNFEGAMNVTTAFLPLLADDATVVNVSSRQAARTLGFWSRDIGTSSRATTSRL